MAANTHGRTLEVRVLRGTRLKNTNSITRQNPYVKLNYGDKEYCTATARGGDVNPSFQDKFEFKLIEGIKSLKVSVCNKRTLSKTVLIGRGKIDMREVLKSVTKNISEEKTCFLYNDTEPAGEVLLMLCLKNPHGLDPYGTSSSASQPYHVAQPTPNHQYHHG